MKFVIPFLVCSLLAAPAASDNLEFAQEIPATSETTMMGAKMAVADGKALVSVWRETQNIDTVPVVFDISTGATERILSSDPQPADSQNARAVALDGARALVCGDATRYSQEMPSIRLFDVNTGALITGIVHDDPERTTTGRYGQSCKIKGDLVIVTDKSFEREGEENRGAVYLYDATTGALIKRILAHAPTPKEHFGTDVAINGNLIAISTTGTDIKHGYHGHVDLYELDSGTHLHRFSRPDNGVSYNSGSFGKHVILTDDTIIISSIFDTLKSLEETGTVWVFELADYALRHRLTPPLTYRDNDLFGASISRYGNQLLVGSPYTWIAKKSGGHGKKEAGMAFLFDLTSGALLQEIQNPSPMSGDYFGSTVALGPWGAVISASKARTNSEGRGALYVYTDHGGT